MTSPLWIDQPDVLQRGVERWLAAEDVALDTEFVFERTFRPQLGLIQVAAGGEIALIDAVRLADLSPLAALLEAPGVRKILHSGSGDVPILKRATGAAPRPLFDTQIAAAFLGLGASLSYAALIRELFAVELPKHETRTNWLRRPLSPEQLRYAAEDVAQLGAAAHELERRLREVGRLEWALEDSAALAGMDDVTEPAKAWRRVRGLDRLPPRGRAVARALAAWREREAERLDLARPFLLRDETLLALARRDEALPAITGPELVKLPGYESGRHALHTARWLDALAAARAAADEASSGEEDAQPSSRERTRRRKLEDAVGKVVARQAAALGIAPELLLSRRQLDRALDTRRDGASLAEAIGGFRGRLLERELAGLEGSASD